jgi:hypothetical protein
MKAALRTRVQTFMLALPAGGGVSPRDSVTHCPFFPGAFS